MSSTGTDQEVEELLGDGFEEAKTIDPKKLNLRDELILLNRVSKVVKGGRRFSFSALVAVGDGNGHVGLGYGKANEVPDAIEKGKERAKKNLIRVPMMGRTIPHQVIGIHDAAKILLKPASEGTGLVAGAAVRKYLALAGLHDILSKSLGSSNILNLIKATMVGLKSLKRADDIAQLRGKKIENLIGARGAKIYQDSRVATLAAENPELAAKQLAAKAAKAAKAEAEKKAEEQAPEAAAATVELTDEPPTTAPETTEATKETEKS